MAKLVFEERQRFTQIWLILLFAIACIIVVKSLFRELESPDLNESSLNIILFTLLPLLLVIFLFFYTSLDSRIDERGIQAVFRPFSFSKKQFKWEEIQTIEVVQYRPLKDYGGWGYRMGKKGNAMNVKGNRGFQIQLKNGKQFLIGTQRPDEVKKVVKTYLATP